MESTPFPNTISLRTSSSHNCSALAAFYTQRTRLPVLGKFKSSHHQHHERLSLVPAATTSYSTTFRRKTVQHVRPVIMRIERDSQESSSGEDAPETLFMKELRRRGMSSITKFEDTDAASSTEMVTLEGTNESGEKIRNAEFRNIGYTLRSTPLLETEKDTNQRERSMALSSEGLDGLLPRAQELLKLGGSFFLAFWPLILASVTTFVVLYIYSGSTFIHFGHGPQGSHPPYVDPYKLLEEDGLKPELHSGIVGSFH